MPGLCDGPRVMMQVEKPERESALKTARTLDWTMPRGRFPPRLRGRGKAGDRPEAGALLACGSPVTLNLFEGALGASDC